MLAPGGWSRTEAREPAAARIDISPGTLSDALNALARERRISIGTEGTLPRIGVARLRGHMSDGEALERLLAGTGYRARAIAPSAWRIERAPPVPRQSAVIPPSLPPAPVAPPIVVTATKQATDILSLPASVSVLDALHMPAGAGGLASTRDVAERVNGLALTALGPGRNRMFLRGIADSAFGGESQSTVAVVLGDTRLTYSAPDPDVRLVDMERVELLKGPQGSLYGSGALGGIYHMVPRPAELGKSDVTLTAGGTTVGGGGSGYTGSAVVNLPIVADVAAVRLVGYTALEPGWIDSGSGADRRRNINATRVSGARGQVAVAATGNWRFDLDGMAQWLNSRDSRYTYIRGSYRRPAQIGEPHDNDLEHVAGRLRGSVGGVAITLSTGMTWHAVTDRFDATVGAGGFGLSDPQWLEDARRYRLWDTELRAQGRWGAIGWLAGLSRIDANQSLDTRLFGGGGRSAMLVGTRRDSHETGAYLDLTVPVASALTAQVGGRLFHSFTGDMALGHGLAKPTSERQHTGFTPSLALSWKPDAARLLYVRYGSSVRQSAPGQGNANGKGAVEGDELASVEIGWRQALRGTGHFEASAWYSRWNHLRSDTLTPSGLVETVQAGDARIAGVELSLVLPLGADWSVEAGGNLTDARLVRNALGYELRTRRLPVVPHYTMRAGLARGFAAGAMKGTAGVYLRYVGPARMSFDPDLDRAMGRVLDNNVEASLTKGAWTLTASASNPLGRRGKLFAYGNPLRYRTTAQDIAQAPPTLSMTVRTGF